MLNKNCNNGNGTTTLVKSCNDGKYLTILKEGYENIPLRRDRNFLVFPTTCDI